MDVLVHMEELRNKREVSGEKKKLLKAVLHVCGSFSYLGNGSKVLYDCQINSKGYRYNWV